MAGITNPRKLRIGQKFCQLMDEYPKVISFSVNLVGSKQLAGIRKHLRGKAEFLFGKNTMLRKVLRDKCERDSQAEPDKAEKLANMLSLIEGNVGLLFHNSDVKEMRDLVEAQTIPCAAKVGIVAPCNVMVSAGPTGCDPTQTAFFQMMEIPTKINRGQVEIVSDVVVIKKGEKVGGSQAALCAKLSITPFAFGPQSVRVYDDGDVFSAEVLDITDEMIEEGFVCALRKASALCMAMDLPNSVSVPHYIYKAWSSVASLMLATETQDTTSHYATYLASFSCGGGGGGGADETAGATAGAEPEKEATPSEAESVAQVNPFGSDSDSDSSS